MKLITKLAVLFIMFKLAKSAPDPCNILEESTCDQTEYEAYKECIHNESKNEVRKRRQLPCPQNNLESLVSIKENCQRANFDCRIKCNDDPNCQALCPVCPINVDELIASNNNTGESHRTIIVENDQNVDKFQTNSAAGNVTTVIRLTNIINTTGSISDLPAVDGGGVDLVNETGGEFGLGANANGSCCYVVHPKICTSTSNGQRCHHRREKMCGKICTAKVVHVQARKRCNSSGCHKKISYIPQPNPPKCIHTRKWPYVACGQSHSYSSSCDGCYDHYDDDEATVGDNNDCDGCYDDGFDYGPLYRQGPVFRPYFYHVPPCYIVGTCIPYPIADGYGFGYFGEYYSHKRRHHEENEDEQFDIDNDEDVDLIKPIVPDANKTADHVADDWAIELQKCKVVSDNGTIEIRNCTTEDFEENPYAGAPTDDVDYGTEDDDYDALDDGIRIQRHAKQFRHPQIVYVPVIQNFGMDTSDEYDFDETPRHRRRVRQSKPSAKRRHRKVNIVYDDEDNDHVDQ